MCGDATYLVGLAAMAVCVAPGDAPAKQSASPPTATQDIPSNPADTPSNPTDTPPTDTPSNPTDTPPNPAEDAPRNPAPAPAEEAPPGETSETVAAPPESPTPPPASEPPERPAPPSPEAASAPEPPESGPQKDAAESNSAPVVEGQTSGPPEPPRLVVLALPLVPKRVDENFAATLDDVLASELATRHHLKVTTLSDINDLLQQEMLKDLVGCEDVACSSQIGGAIGADRILAGSVGHFGENYVLTLRWLDAIYHEPLARTTVPVAKESGAPAAAREALRQLLNESRTADETSQRRKRRPTFWTVEVAGGADLITAPEPYDIEANASVRLAWGGQPRGFPVFLYAVAGFGIDFLSGRKHGPTGSISYQRTQLTPFAELRLAVPVSLRNRVRLYGAIGTGLTAELYRAEQSGGITPDGTSYFPELRLLGGVWYRWHHHHAAFLAYRSRTQFRGDGADSISELIQAGSSESTFWIHAVEIGWAFHF